LQLGCGKRVEFADSKTAIRSLCSDILVELSRIVELQVPAGFWDLFLEEGAYSFIYLIYLFIHGLFNYADSSSDYTASNGWMISE
jgi:hypothetical protein